MWSQMPTQSLGNYVLPYATHGTAKQAKMTGGKEVAKYLGEDEDI